MLEILPIPAFEDNYIWLIKDGRHAVAVDPGDARPLIQQLEQSRLMLDAILITHHHHDHTGGVAELISKYNVPVYAPAKEAYDFEHIPVTEGQKIVLEELGLALNVMEVPGHTLGHVAYYAHPHLFCGDTLFSCGCGRLFEGTAEQLYHSLQRFARLPPDTLVYCTHEYTTTNIGFSLQLDPHNPALLQWQKIVNEYRKSNKPSLPTTIEQELQTNPFLRCHTSAIKQAANKPEQATELEVFSIIRKLRNHY